MAEKVVLEVEGMTCNHCASTVDGIIQQCGGKAVHVDYLLGEASFELGNEKQVERILKRLNSAGYTSQEAALHEEESERKKERFSAVEKKFLISLPFSLVLFMHMFLPMDWWINDPYVQLMLCVPVYVIGFRHFGKSSWESLRSRTINMDILIFIGSTSAFVYSIVGTLLFEGQERVHDFLFFETTSTIITLVLLGYVIEHRAVQKTTVVLKKLLDSKPLKAKRLIQKGLNQEMEPVLAMDLEPGERILVNAGDKVPADASIEYGDLRVDESVLTGESDVLHKTKGDQLLSGSLIIDGNGVLRVEKNASESTIGKIIDLVKESRASRPEIQKLADRISSVFVPAILIIALITFGVNYWLQPDLGEALLRAIAVLVISCPCAMGLATPTAVSVGLGIAGNLGLVVKRADVFEQLQSLRSIVFDKTGTLTESRPEVKLKIHNGFDQDEVTSLIRSLEAHSNHPLAEAIGDHVKGSKLLELEAVEEVKGRGITGQWRGKGLKLGSAIFTGQSSAEGDVFLLVDELPAAAIVIQNRIQSAAQEVVESLQARGLQPHILSGDSERKTRDVAARLGIQQFASEQLPDQKLTYIKELRTEGATGMVGDGINDAPSLVAADVGISIGNSNALAAESASVVIMGSNIQRLKQLFEIGSAVVSTIRQNLFWAFAYNLVAIPLAAAGFLDPMVAALSMAFSDVVVIGNSLRLRLRLSKQLH